MKIQYTPVSEEDFEFLYKKTNKDESLILDYIGIFFSIAVMIFFLNFFDFNLNIFNYLDFNHLLKPYYL